MLTLIIVYAIIHPYRKRIARVARGSEALSEVTIRTQIASALTVSKVDRSLNGDVVSIRRGLVSKIDLLCTEYSKRLHS